MSSLGELYGMKNGLHYIYIKAYNEMAAFNNQGNQVVGKKDSILSCKGVMPVDIVSIAGVSPNGAIAEVAFNGEKAIFNSTVTSLFQKLRRSGYMKTFFRVDHSDLQVNLMHIILMYREGEMSRERLEALLKVPCDWRRMES